MTSKPASVSFDQATAYYDKTRALSDKTMRHCLDLLEGELRGSRVLEIGVGSGRFALPLKERGVEMAGVDLSSKMLGRLVDNAGGEAPFPVTSGDATRLPFRDSAFGAALGIHVLHLIPGWRSVIEEVTRVLGPQGRFVVDLGSWGHGEWHDLQMLFCEVAGIAPEHPGLNDPKILDAEMERRGYAVRVLPQLTERQHHTYGDVIGSLERGIYSFTWRTDQSGRTRGAAALKALIAGRGKALEDIATLEFLISFRVYEPAG